MIEDADCDRGLGLACSTSRRGRTTSCAPPKTAAKRAVYLAFSLLFPTPTSRADNGVAAAEDVRRSAARFERRL